MRVKMTESPRSKADQSTFRANGENWRHVSQTGKEQIDIILHGASSLPSVQKGRPPHPYASIKTKSTYNKNDATTIKTHSTARPTAAPSWEEMLSVEIDEQKSNSEALVMTVGDSASKSRLVNYELPINHLQPFHQYHLELVTPHKEKTDGVRMYASIMRKLNKLPLHQSSPNYLGLEAHLQSVKYPIINPMGPLIAVARIVPDYYNYRSDNLLPHPRTAGVNMTSVTFPQPHPSSFKVPEKSSQGYPQISLPGRPDEQPTWNHPYLFSEEKDKATLFTPSAALVIEYYVANKAMNDQFWRMESPVGFSSLLLDHSMYTQLIQDEARMGLRIEGLPIQMKDGEMPPYDAMDSILPEYEYIYKDDGQGPVITSTEKTTNLHVVQTNDQLPSVSSKIYHYSDPDYTNVIERQDQELTNYRSQLRRMGDDIVELRTTLGNYETVQSNNRRDDTTKLLIDAREMDGLPKADIMTRYAQLKQKLAFTYTELKSYKDKVQRLQNELIKKNDQQKDFLKLHHAHTGQQELLQKLQSKAQLIKKLEDTIRKQERVIDKLERALDRKYGHGKTPIPSNNAGEINSTLSAENRHLRQQIEDLKEQLRLGGKSNNDDLEKLELYQALERAEGRIMSLERQLTENARYWGKEKADLSIRANEIERGFRHGAGMILHDYPVLEEICSRPIRKTCLDPIH
ncbi:hypothetical protein LOTGIDRAFT_210495 [Lottia gigantea]|uniref:C2 domain-containing protein n=1 Tax=Lottia gigantea TaxID=225164 RepID=V3ZS04_LOTGI|nr:hypothetical protein LOTGIDRAFT_210495 [Lottia gigantea]ESO87132.1 hypothetical protein LOTGIDRAFT_210495 [Lottia gigantea]